MAATSRPNRADSCMCAPIEVTQWLSEGNSTQRPTWKRRIRDWARRCVATQDGDLTGNVVFVTRISFPIDRAHAPRESRSELKLREGIEEFLVEL